jgi:hypothetical protein
MFACAENRILRANLPSRRYAQDEWFYHTPPALLRRNFGKHGKRDWVYSEGSVSPHRYILQQNSSVKVMIRRAAMPYFTERKYFSKVDLHQCARLKRSRQQ